MKKIIILFFALHWMTTPIVSASQSVADKSGMHKLFHDKYSFEDTQMTLVGTGQKKVFFIKAFTAGLYLQEDALAQDPLSDVAKRLEVEYFVNINGKDLNRFTIETMRDNITEAEMAQLQDKLQNMARYFVDLKPGDRFALTYIPDVGTKFSHNGQIQGIIPGHQFSRALFSVWFGEKPFDAGLKKQILNSTIAQGYPPTVRY
ncbi:MAG: chalcone isomerase family protein [Candidatus Omnitrophica bacterium]|nr:chalcone isomerase family protein [Candidatus Omnitrophota bacterium]